MKWKDETTYRSNDKERKPTTFSAQCGQIRLEVTSGHIHHPGKWVAHAYPLFECKVLKANTRDEAQAEAVHVAREWLAAAEAGLAA